MAVENWAEALGLAETIKELNSQERASPVIGRTVYRLRMTANLGSNNIDAALSDALSWSRLESGGTIVPLLRVASHLCRTEQFERAVAVFEDVRDTLDAYPVSVAEFAEALWHTGRREEAAAAADRVGDDAPSAARLRLRALRSLIGSSVASLDRSKVDADRP